jgi:hypothetical protein
VDVGLWVDLGKDLGFFEKERRPDYGLISLNIKDLFAK